MAKAAYQTNLEKLKKSLEQIPPDRKPIADSLLRELGFMQKTLDALKKTIETEGVVDTLNMKESPALKSYNTTIQRYSQLYRQIAAMLPKQDAGDADRALRDFLRQE